MSETGLNTFPLFGDVAALICSFLSALDSYAALVIFRKLAGGSVVIHRRIRERCGLPWILTYVNGLLHSVGGKPAVERPSCLPFATGIRSVWYCNGLPHRDGYEPALIQTGQDKTGQLVAFEQSWFTHGEFRNDHRPSTVTPTESCWRIATPIDGGRHGLLHRMNDLPAAIGIDVMEWAQFGRHCRRDANLPHSIWCFGTMVWEFITDNRPVVIRPVVMHADGAMIWLVNSEQPDERRREIPPDESDTEAFNTYKARFLSFYPIHLVDRVQIQRDLGFLQPADFPADE